MNRGIVLPLAAIAVFAAIPATLFIRDELTRRRSGDDEDDA